MRLNRPLIVLLLALLALLLVSVPASSQEMSGPHAVAEVKNAAGDILGEVTFTEIAGNKIEIAAELSGLEPGFHGFHVHAVGQCDASTESAFTSAGGHLNFGEDAATHGKHQGDLPSLLVMADGTAQLILVTDRFALIDLLDADGSAVIVHAAADNFGNIPVDRYDPDPDEATLNTGDAGGRVGCGLVEGAGS